MRPGSPKEIKILVQIRKLIINAMKKKNLLLSLLILLPDLSYSQSIYQIGTSQASIEPDQSLISLHLGGYGGPRDGRFSLQWINKGAVPEVTAMGGLTDKLYIVSNSD